MSTIPDEKTEVASLLDESVVHGIIMTEDDAKQLIDLVGNHDVCIDALLMEKRPEWLVAIVGKAKAKAK